MKNRQNIFREHHEASLISYRECRLRIVLRFEYYESVFFGVVYLFKMKKKQQLELRIRRRLALKR